MLKLVTVLFFAGVPLFAQIQVSGGAAISSNQTKPMAALEARVSRAVVGASYAPKAAALGTVAIRIWKGAHLEGGGGFVRGEATSSFSVQLPSEPIFAGWGPKAPIVGWKDPAYETRTISYPVWRSAGTAGAYYQLGKKVFARVGYRRLFVSNAPNENQLYLSAGVSF